MIRRLLAVLFFIGLIAAGLAGVGMFLFFRTSSFNPSDETIVVEKGATLDQVIRQLDEKKIITNPLSFKIYVLAKGASGSIRAGEYVFPPRLKPSEVLALLLKGDFATRRITIPEGWTAREIAAFLGREGLVNPDLFLQKVSDPLLIRSSGLTTTSLEGYLYPDTYEIYKPKDEEEVVLKLVRRFFEVYGANGGELEVKSREAGMSREDIVTLASIIEKETGSKDERPLIASVFLNRLKKGMPLASDPTVIYGVLISSGGFDGNLTRTHLSTPGPYNTYLKTGLPPTPIANPGIDSIRAVLYPVQTEYLFFVSKNDGTHYFSKTEEEHFAAVRKYQMGR